MPRPASSSQRLYDVASGQGGYFTSRQALDAGYGDNLHPYHVRAGNWVRERRGVYRLTQFPQPSRPDLIVLQLWSRNRQDEPQGVFSHTTALTLHDLSDAMPAKVDMTVPPGFRRMAAIPGVLRLHRGGVPKRDAETIEGVRVTTPLRTLIDVIVEGALAPEVLVQAVDQAIRRGLVRRRQFDAADVSTRARQRVNRILKQVPDERPTPVRNSRRPAGRTGSATPRPRTA